MQTSRATGPRTTEGKARSSQNALKHGLRSRNLIIGPGQQEEFDEFQCALAAAVKPLGQLELFVFQQLVRAGWDLRRVETRIALLASSGTDPFEDPELFKQYDLFERYRHRAEGSYYRAQRELRILQTNRVLQQAIPEPLGLGALPALANPQQIVQLAKRTRKHWPHLAVNRLIDLSTTQPAAPPALRDLAGRCDDEAKHGT